MIMHYSMHYTERIKALREDNDYKQTYVANAIHVAQTTYSDYENKSEKAISVFKSLRFKKGKLYTEFAYNGSIYSFTLETKA